MAISIRSQDTGLLLPAPTYQHRLMHTYASPMLYLKPLSEVATTVYVRLRVSTCSRQLGVRMQLASEVAVVLMGVSAVAASNWTTVANRSLQM